MTTNEATKGAGTINITGTISDDDSSPISISHERANRNISQKRSVLHWFDPNDGPTERRLIVKLDFFVLSFACLGFWVLYIDRGILANAYVSGMKEDLGFYGNQLVQLNAVYNVGYAVSMIPFTLSTTKFRPEIVIPTIMTVWALFTLLSYRAQSFGELAAYRFLVGLFTGPFFCTIHYVLGSWYRPDELVRRSGIFYISSGVGTATTGLLAARIMQSLDGQLGHPGWKWMYIIGSVVTFPVALWGFVTFPGTPNFGKRWYFTDEEFELARERMRLVGSTPPQGFSFNLPTLKRFFGRWHFWVLVPWNVLWILGYMSQSQGAYTLWLKAQKQYSVIDVNNLTAVNPTLGIIWIWSFSWIADKYGNRARLLITGFTCLLMFIGYFAFVFYEQTSFAFKWFLVAIGYMDVSLSPLIYSWANIICAGDAEERAFVISSMLAVGTAFTVWVPLVAFPTVEAPEYRKGYITQIVMQPAYFFWTLLVYIISQKEKKRLVVKGSNPTEER